MYFCKVPHLRPNAPLSRHCPRHFPGRHSSIVPTQSATYTSLNSIEDKHNTLLKSTGLIMAPPAKKKKVENRQFNDDWQLDFFFTMPPSTSSTASKPTCLICSKTMASVRRHDLKRHHDTNHAEFVTKYPLGSDERKQKMTSLLRGYTQSSRLLIRTSTLQEKSTEVSYRVSWILNKAKMPFTSSEVVKECLVESAKVLCPTAIVDTFKRIPLSDDSNTRRAEDLASNVKATVINKLRTSLISLAIDESTDICDVSQLSMFVRFLDKESGIFREELLGLVPMLGSTTGEDVCTEIVKCFNDNQIPLENIVSLVTDGAPAMVGKHKGVAALLKKQCPKLISFHCIIHNSVLCSKLKAEFSESMDTLIRLVNFLRSNSAKKHRDLRQFLNDNDAEFADIPLHTAVRWLSKGKVLQRMWKLKDLIVAYLETCDGRPKAEEYLHFLNDDEPMTVLAFLVDIFTYLDELNLTLQGKNKTLGDCRKAVVAFEAKLALYKNDLVSNELAFFPTLKQYSADADTSPFVEFMDNLIEEFQTRFATFKDIDNLLLMVRNPFIVEIDGLWLTQAKNIDPGLSTPNLQTQLIDLQSDDELQILHKSKTSAEFWLSIPQSCNELKSLSLKVVGMFGSTYVCESSFSNMNYIKNKYRTRLTDSHLEDVMRISTTTYVPDFARMARFSKCHFSH